MARPASPKKPTRLAAKPKPARVTADSSRVRKLKRRQLHKQARTDRKARPLPTSIGLLRTSLKHLWIHKRLFGGILFIYALLTLIFVKAGGPLLQLDSLRDQLGVSLGDGGLGVGVTLYGLLIGSAASPLGEVAGLYQTIFLTIISLAVIWALRQSYAAGKGRLRIRDSFYFSMYPLIPYMLVFFVIILQLLPLLIGSSLYILVRDNGLAATGTEQIFWLLILIASAVPSLFWTSGSLQASYVVTLPGRTPWQALRAGRDLVRFRRFTVIRKIVFLPVFLLVFSALVIIPLISFTPIAADITFLIFSVLAIFVVHSYYYALYRSLL